MTHLVLNHLGIEDLSNATPYRSGSPIYLCTLQLSMIGLVPAPIIEDDITTTGFHYYRLAIYRCSVYS